MDVDHSIIFIFIFLKVDNVIRGIVEKQLAKKRHNVLVNVISFFFFFAKDLFKKDNVQQKKFCTRPWPFDCEKSLFFSTNEKCLI